jgi:uncharacterized protein DUF6790
MELTADAEPQAYMETIFWIGSNWFLLLFVVAVCTTIAKVRRLSTPRIGDIAYIAWGELLVYGVGVWFIYAGIGHAYFQEVTAPRIGWQPSPFQFELGWMEIPLGFVTIAALWRGYEFRLASTTIVATFSLACAAQHIQQMICCGNYSPNNAGPILWFADIFVPLLLLCLAALSGFRRTVAE